MCGSGTEGEGPKSIPPGYTKSPAVVLCCIVFRVMVGGKGDGRTAHKNRGEFQEQLCNSLSDNYSFILHSHLNPFSVI